MKKILSTTQDTNQINQINQISQLNVLWIVQFYTMHGFCLLSHAVLHVTDFGKFYAGRKPYLIGGRRLLLWMLHCPNRQSRTFHKQIKRSNPYCFSNNNVFIHTLFVQGAQCIYECGQNYTSNRLWSFNTPVVRAQGLEWPTWYGLPIPALDTSCRYNTKQHNNIIN